MCSTSRSRESRRTAPRRRPSMTGPTEVGAGQGWSAGAGAGGGGDPRGPLRATGDPDRSGVGAWLVVRRPALVRSDLLADPGVGASRPGRAADGAVRAARRGDALTAAAMHPARPSRGRTRPASGIRRRWRPHGGSGRTRGARPDPIREPARTHSGRSGMLARRGTDLQRSPGLQQSHDQSVGRNSWTSDTPSPLLPGAPGRAGSRNSARSCSASAAVSGDWRPLCVVTPRGRRPGTADRFD